MEVRQAEQAKVRFEADGPWFVVREREARLAAFALEHAGHALSYEEIGAACGFEQPTRAALASAIRVTVCNLRRRTGQEIVIPVPGYGWVLPKPLAEEG